MRIYLTNLGKYNEGELVGQWLDLPATDEDIEKIKKAILIDGEEYEEMFITDYEDSPIKIHEYDSLDYLNEVAEAYENLSDTEKKVLSHYMNYHGYEFKEAKEKLDEGDYLIYENIKDEEALGYELAENMEIPKHLENYINYEAIGNDATCSGWVIDKDEEMAIYTI